MFICSLINIVVSNQHIKHADRFFLATTGLATGLGAGVFLANIYLYGMDTWLLQQLSQRNMLPLLFCRFVDDVLMLVRRSWITDIQNLANSWHQNIKYKLSMHGTHQVPFLDLALSLSESRVTHTIYRKPLATYQYPIATSAHPPHTMVGVAAGETIRILRRCQCRKQALSEVRFLLSKLRARGHRHAGIGKTISSSIRKFDSKRIDKTCSRASLSNTTRIQMRVSYMSLPFSSALDAKHIKRTLHRLLPALRMPTKVMLPYRLQPSIFRRMYSSNWFD